MIQTINIVIPVAQLRASNYPPLQDLADALYWQSKGDNTKMDAYMAAVEAVKIKYPKTPNI